METIYLVSAQWEHEGAEDLVAFREKKKAEVFAAECKKYQETDPEDYSLNWNKRHPAGKFLKPGAHLHGVEGYPITEIKVL